ncbi:murein hydrolase activator EnvC family protein [Vreelandella aquamarina]
MRGFIAPSFIVLGFACCIGLASPALGQEESESGARRLLESIGQKIEAVAKRLTATGSEREQVARELQEIETELAETHQRLDALNSEKSDLDAQAGQLRQQREQLQEERRLQSAALSEQLVALHRLGPTLEVKLLLNQEDPAQLDRMQTYLNRLGQARRQRIAAIAELDSALANTADELQTHQARLDTLADELEEQREQLAKRTSQRQELVAELDARHQTEEERLAALEAEREEARRTLQRIREEMVRLSKPSPSTHFRQTQGELPWPVQGNLHQGFHQDRGVHREGIMIHASAGAPVTAVHQGRVVFSDWMRGFGNLMIIDHGDHIMTLYAHLQRFSVTTGQVVQRGDEIGRVGNTGGQSQAGLYFEVRQRGEPTNPEQWIARR